MTIQSREKGTLITALAFCGWLLMLVPTIDAQTFSSGSTGSDGALTLNFGATTVSLPESGVLNYTTISIAPGAEVRFKNNLRNTPVVILAQGAVNIGGMIDASSVSSCPGGGCGCSFVRLGPGGYSGGVNSPGFGPGGGTPPANSTQTNGRWVGPLSLVPLVGGSGADGTGFGKGGDGGGAVVIASSTSITISGEVRANGSTTWTCSGTPTYGGSGGAIRLVANSISISGTIRALGGSSASPDYAGLIRVEAPSGQLNFSGSSNPPAIMSTINPTIVAANAPSLIIAAVGGYPVPPLSVTPLDNDRANVILPRQLPDPIDVLIQAANIPVGTTVTVQTSGSTSATSTSCSLAGSFTSSSATCTVSGLNRSAITYLLAMAVFDPPASTQASNPRGHNHVATLRIESKPGTRPKFTFLRTDGTVIDQAKLPKKFLEQFGL